MPETFETRTPLQEDSTDHPVSRKSNEVVFRCQLERGATDRQVEPLSRLSWIDLSLQGKTDYLKDDRMWLILVYRPSEFCLLDWRTALDHMWTIDTFVPGLAAVVVNSASSCFAIASTIPVPRPGFELAGSAGTPTPSSLTDIDHCVLFE